MRRFSQTRIRRLIVASTAIAACIFCALITLHLYQTYRALEKQSYNNASAVVLSLERSIGRTIESLDAFMQSAITVATTPGFAVLDQDKRTAALSAVVRPTGLDVVAVFDAAGERIADTGPWSPRPVSVADRPYFQAHARDPGLGLVVTKPLIGRMSQRWSIVLARRISRADGSFGGVVIGSVPLDPIRAFFASLHLRSGSSVALYGKDGQLLVRWPGTAADFAGPESGADLPGKLGDAGTGVFDAVSGSDGLRRLNAYSQVGGLPLIVAVGMSKPRLFNDWLNTAVPSLALLLLLALALAVYGTALQTEWRLRGRAERQALHSAAELAAMVSRLEALFENSPDALQIIEVRPDGSFAWELVSPAFSRLYGMPAQTLPGQSPQDCLPAETADPILACWRDCVASRQLVAVQHHGVVQGVPRDLEKIVAPVFDGAGRVVRLVGSIRDVTLRRQTEASLRQAQKMEIVGQLTAGVAHDFNNLLQAVIGALDMLEGHVGLASEPQLCMSVARKAAFRGAALTSRLLTVSRQQELDPALLDLAEVFDEIGQLCETTLGPRVVVSTAVQPGVWPILVDASQVTTCLINLAVNARDAMPGGGTIRVSARNHAAGDAGRPAALSGDFVVIRVEDDGVGMPPDVLARASDPFFTTKGVGKGSGLGLAMVQGFAAQSGGAMIIASVHGHGTSVEIWLPRAAGLRAAPLPARAIAQGQSGRVLLVDDDTEVRAILNLMIVGGGYAVTCVDSAGAALALLAEDAGFDVLLTDYAMPAMSGARLIADAARIAPGLPALLMTGTNQNANYDRDLPVGIRILRKPVRQHDLILQIKAAVAGRLRSGQPAMAPDTLPNNVVRLAARVMG